jgi:hypothetical protein
VLASLPVSDLEAGSRRGVAALRALEKTFGFVAEERGSHELKGVPEPVNCTESRGRAAADAVPDSAI